MATLRMKLRQKCNPLSKKSVPNLQKLHPFNKNSVRNATPRAEIMRLHLTGLGQPLEFWGAILNPLSLLYLDFALPVANKLVLTSDRVYLCACILPGDLLFCAPEGRIAPIGASYPELIILSSIGALIPKP